MSTTLKKYFPTGTLVKWSASAENFHTSSGEMILNDDTTLNIELKDSKIAFEWDGGGTKTVWFGNKEVTSTSPILIVNDSPITMIGYENRFENDSTTKNVFLDAVGLTSNTPYIPTLFNYKTNVIENIEIINSSHITDLSNTFEHMKHLKTVSIDTSGVIDMEFMFSDCMIENPPYLNTSNVTNVNSMFYKCTNLKNIPQYDFSNVTNMYGTFWLCPNITSIPYLDTHNVTNIEFCFAQCTKLESIPLLDFSKVTNAGMIFNNCTSLKNVGGFIGLKTDINFEYSPLTHDSALNIIDNLAVSSGHRVIFKKITFDTLTPAEIARATDKGWTITYIS